MNTTPPRSSQTVTSPATGTMRAIVQDMYGPAPEAVLRVADIARPAPGADGVLVRVAAASVDRGTCHLMAGLPYPVRLAGFGVRKPKTNPGRSLAGTVEAVGANVTAFAPGQDVYGVRGGSFAEFVVASPSKLALKPANASWEAAAATPISGLTALQAVRDRGNVQAGQKVLVIGASGGVGSFALQIAKAFGAEVTAVAGTANLDFVRELGADHVVDYTCQDIADAGQRYDVILDTGGNRSLRQLRGVLAPAGRLVIVGGETGGRWLGGLDRQLRAMALSRFVKQTLGTVMASENAADLDALRVLIEAGAVTPAVDRAYPLSETAAAMRHLLDGGTRGKVAITL